MTQPITMTGMPYVPLDPQWVLASPAFHSRNHGVVKAVTLLLVSAWQGTPAGSVPASFRQLAAITGLSEAELADSHEDLFEGWVLRDARLHFPPMSALCERVSSRFADVMQSVADQAAAVIQAPEEFTLEVQEVSSTRRGKHLLPKDWQLGRDMRDYMASNGLPEQFGQDFVATKFTTHYRSKGIAMQKWDQAFQNFFLKEDLSRVPRRVPDQAVQISSSRANRFGSAGIAAQEHNNAMLRDAVMRRSSHAG